MCNKKNLQLIKEKFDLIVELSNTIEYETRDLTFRENNDVVDPTYEKLDEVFYEFKKLLKNLEKKNS